MMKRLPLLALAMLVAVSLNAKPSSCRLSKGAERFVAANPAGENSWDRTGYWQPISTVKKGERVRWVPLWQWRDDGCPKMELGGDDWATYSCHGYHDFVWSVDRHEWISPDDWATSGTITVNQ